MLEPQWIKCTEIVKRLLIPPMYSLRRIRAYGELQTAVTGVGQFKQMVTRHSVHCWLNVVGRSVNDEEDYVLRWRKTSEARVIKVISQSLQLQARLPLVSLGWCHKTRECAKSCVRKYISVLLQSEAVPVLVRLRSNCNHVTQVGGTVRFMDRIVLYLARCHSFYTRLTHKLWQW